MSEQLAFTRLLADADEQSLRALDRHRERVQAWFDALPVQDRQKLAEWFATYEWDTCASLAAAAGDYHATHF
jgi:uncharacterized protein YaeQ